MISNQKLIENYLKKEGMPEPDCIRMAGNITNILSEETKNSFLLKIKNCIIKKPLLRRALICKDCYSLPKNGTAQYCKKGLKLNETKTRCKFKRPKNPENDSFKLKEI